MLILFGLSMIMPFFWMVSTSFRSTMEITRDPHRFTPEVLSSDFGAEGTRSEGEERSPSRIFANYAEAWQSAPFARYFFNTVFVALSCVLGVVVTSSLAAYAFARMRFKGRDWIFMLFLSMMMVPEPVYLVPSFIIIARLHWLDTYYALIIPWTVKVFSIFLLRQHFKTIPQDLFDAATIDGASRFSILWKIVLPLSKAIMVTIVLFGIIGSWNSFLWPLVMTHSPEMRPIQIGLAAFSQEEGTEFGLMMAATCISVLPLLIMYFFAQKQIIASLASSGLKE
ncbi:MAG: carbohydrate ABC transporter permease [bacterium]|nr:carbohydrate ABC transporter permease [bacterium]